MDKPVLAAFDPLQNLLTRVRVAQTPKVKRESVHHLRKDVAAADARLKAIYQNPENWALSQTVALVHRGTETLLGNFEEYVNVVVAGCRKLVRVEGPREVLKVEYVDGPHWVPDQSSVFKSPAWDVKREAVVDLFLASMGLAAVTVPVVVQLHMGHISKVELAEATCFRSLDKHTILSLPPGINVLDEMGLDCRLALKAELEQEDSVKE